MWGLGWHVRVQNLSCCDSLGLTWNHIGSYLTYSVCVYIYIIYIHTHDICAYLFGSWEARIPHQSDGTKGAANLPKPLDFLGAIP